MDRTFYRYNDRYVLRVYGTVLTWGVDDTIESRLHVTSIDVALEAGESLGYSCRRAPCNELSDQSNITSEGCFKDGG